jgi:hypothetical protein
MEFNKWIIVAFLIGMVALFALINFVNQGLYSTGCCWLNGNFSCGMDCPDWNGECTSEIKDECCMDVRMCGGTVSDPSDCWDDYCTTEGKMCDGVYQVGGMYECKCVDIEQL